MNIEVYRFVRLIFAGIGRRPGNMGQAVVFIYGERRTLRSRIIFVPIAR
jgi:hypothetical protein